ncbi:LysR family transcriptional regulator [Providencia hangzhouensis]|uniref:helix-turn-helix domain-containing protein n=2 Tax=Providencia hangzhouensis TaxID=3031799 RepID=UPI0034DD6BE3
MFFSKQLNQFIALAKNGSLNQAAESTNVTSSAISQGLILLEKKLGKNILVKKIKYSFPIMAWSYLIK